MLKINNLTITTNTGRVLINNFSLIINDNDKIALIGEEGNGKSTLLKIIAGIDVSDYVSYSGEIITDQIIAYMPQHIEDKYLNLDTLSFISDDIDYNHLYSLMNKINIDILLLNDRTISSLSGGEKVKLSLLKILYSNPDIILLDEPTNDLDLKTLLWLEDFINKSNKTILFISHDETLLENCAKSIIHLEQLKRKTESLITYSGNNYIEYRKYRNDLIDKTNMIAKKEKQEFKKQLDKWRKIYQKVDHAQRNVSRQDPHSGRLLKKKMHAVKSLQKNLEIKKENLTAKFEPEEAINISFEDVYINPNKIIIDIFIDELKIKDKVLCQNIELKILGKDKVCIIGDNGSGKSTLLKYIFHKLIDRDDISIGYMPQNYYEIMDYSLKPIEFLWDGKRKEDKIKIERYLGSLKFTAQEMLHKIENLSDGQKCKLLLIKLILDKNNVLLLDEPTRNLSPLSNPIIRKILDDYNGCIIAISHDRKFIEEVSNRLFMIEDNKIKEIY